MGKKLNVGAEKIELTPRQELFCKLFATEREFLGNGVQSYIEAFDIDANNKAAYNGARTEASKLLTKPNIIARINVLLEGLGLNDSNVDKQLTFLINQSADFSAKVAAIREYNKLKKRISDSVTLDGSITVKWDD